MKKKPTKPNNSSTWQAHVQQQAPSSLTRPLYWTKVTVSTPGYQEVFPCLQNHLHCTDSFARGMLLLIPFLAKSTEQLRLLAYLWSSNPFSPPSITQKQSFWILLKTKSSDSQVYHASKSEPCRVYLQQVLYSCQLGRKNVRALHPLSTFVLLHKAKKNQLCPEVSKKSQDNPKNWKWRYLSQNYPFTACSWGTGLTVTRHLGITLSEMKQVQHSGLV